MSSLSLGIDIGGTTCEMALVSRAGQALQIMKKNIPPPENPKRFVKELLQDIRRFVGSHRKQIVRCVLGCAGDIDARRGVVRFSPNHGWRNLPLVRMLQRGLSMRVLLENDANATAWGAYVVESHRRARSLVCVTLGTGIGGGIVLDGKLWRGESGSAGELGHTNIEPNGRLCSCGNRGCVEAYAGGRTLVARAKSLLRQRSSLVIRRLTYDKNRRNITPEILHEAAKRGDGISLAVWREAGEALGIALSSLVNLLNPERIYFAGGISKASRLIFPTIRQVIRKRAFPGPAEAVRLYAVKRFQSLGAIGAGLLGFEQG